MMTVLITDTMNENGLTCLELVCGKKKASVCYSHGTGRVDVLCVSINARLFGYGRTFLSWSEAIDAYKSAEVKLMIETAMDAVKPQLALVS